MSLQRALIAFGATMALFGSVADASAQYTDRQRLERQRIHPSAARPVMQARPVVQSRSVVQPRPAAVTTTAIQSIRPNAAVARPATVAAKPPAAEAIKAAPPPPPPVPLTEEQLAAKAAVEELLSREPALAAAKERPDPQLSKVAKARHDAHEQKLSALKVKEVAEAARRKELEDKNKMRTDMKRDDIKNASHKSKIGPQPKNAAASPKATKPEPEAKKTTVATMTPAPALSPAPAPAAPAQPLLRMPAP